MENNIKDMAIRHQEERRLLKEGCSHDVKDMTLTGYGSFLCERCLTIMPDDYIIEKEQEARKEDLHRRITDLKLEILSDGRIRFKRGDQNHNREMKKLLSQIIDGNEEVLQSLDEFFEGAESVELLIGDTIFCG